MTNPNESSSGNADAPEKATPARSTRAKRASTDGGLVKAKDLSVIVLADDTRVVETDTLPNHRPIALSTFEVVGTLPGDRPIAANTFDIFTTDTLPGHRPVSVSTLHIADIHTLPGDRPIADNIIDPPPAVLMGYLD